VSYRVPRFTNSEIARDFLARLRKEGVNKPVWFHFMQLGLEAGEAQQAYVNIEGLSRHEDTIDHLAEELADTVITAYICAAVSGIDLDSAIQKKHTVLMTRELSQKGIA
jgi:hypothetical protein